MAAVVTTVYVASAQDLAWAEAHKHLLGAIERHELLLLGSHSPRGQQFLVSRVLRRWAVQKATGLAAHHLQYCVDAAGCPRVALSQAGQGETALLPQVSLAHGQQHVAVAVATGAAASVGLDTESSSRFAQEPLRASRLARSVCTPSEQRRLQQVPQYFAATAFLQAWALKEAVCKCLGQGLRGPWREVAAHVPLGPLAPLECRWADAPVELPERWAGLAPHPIHCALVDCGAQDSPVVALAVAAAAPVTVRCERVGFVLAQNTEGQAPRLL